MTKAPILRDFLLVAAFLSLASAPTNAQTSTSPIAPDANAAPSLTRPVGAQDRALHSNESESLAAIGQLAAKFEAEGRFADSEPLRKRIFDARVLALGSDHPDTLRSADDLAYVYVELGKYAQAEPLYIRGLETRERILGNEHPETLGALIRIASLFEDQGRYAEAEALYSRGLEASERQFGKEHPLTLAFVNGQAIVYSGQGRYEVAEPLLVRVLDARERLYGKEGPYTLETLTNLTNAYGAQGKFSKAIPLGIRAVEVSERVHGKEHLNTLGSIYNLAILYEYSGHYAEADPLFARTLAVHERLLGPQHPNSLKLNYALTTNRLSDPALTQGALEPARALIAGMRARRISSDASAYIQAQVEREGKKRPNDFIWFAEAAWFVSEGNPKKRQNLEAEAFMALQDAISGMAGKAVSQMAVRELAERKASGLGVLVRQRQDLDSRWDVNAAQFSMILSDAGAEGLARRSALRLERQNIEGEMDRLDARLRVEFPDYFALVRSEPVSIGETQKLLGSDEAIVLAVQSTMSTHVIAVSRTSIKWSRTHWDKDITAEGIKRLLWDVGADAGVDAATAGMWEAEGGRGYPFDRTTAHALHNQLIVPVQSVLSGKRHIFIAAGGALSSFPFGILVTEPPQGADGDPAALRATKWFADAHALIVIPSIQSLQFLRNTERRSQRLSAREEVTFVGYGDPALSGKAVARGSRFGGAIAARAIFSSSLGRDGKGVANVAELRSLARLPGTATELENMRTALAAPLSAVHVQQQATERAIRSADLSHVRVLAFATHGLMAGELTGAAEPGLVFTPPITASEEDDGYLSASEVSGLKLNADWVILSACNTAAGDGSEGAPGLSGLARAFFYSGARNLLVSHWPVRDDVAARITVDAIKRQRAKPGRSRAEALQEAMRAIRNDASHDTSTDSWAHPNAWAAFSLIGNGAN